MTKRRSRRHRTGISGLFPLQRPARCGCGAVIAVGEDGGYLRDRLVCRQCWLTLPLTKEIPQ